MSTRTILPFIIALCLVFSTAARAADRPNVLFIMADDVGREVLGCYGGTSYRTPHIDQLAKTGMRFTHAYSMPVCHPTRIALMTGRYPFRFDAGWGKFPTEAEGKTIANVMRMSDIHTAVAGKWQLVLMKNDKQQPRRLGFDEWAVFGWHEGPRYHDPMIYRNGEVWPNTEGKYGPDLYADFLIDFMEKNKDGQFFAYFPMALCHDVTDDLKDPVPYAPGLDRYHNYGEMVAHMDRIVGRLVAALDRLKLREKTLIVFTTDNGTPGRIIIRAEKNEQTGKIRYERIPVSSQLGDETIPGGKGKLTDTGTRVPLIANWRGTIEAGQVVDDLIDFSDFLPTFAEVTGAQVPARWSLDGRSFAWRLLGKDGEPRRWCYAGLRGEHWVRTQRYKLYADGRFFDVENDAKEKQAINVEDAGPEAKKAHAMLKKVIERLGVK